MDQKLISKAKALEAYSGSQSDLARALGVSRQAVHKLPDGPIPERWELKLRYELRPDIWPAQKKAA